jgi:hypothetical protein
VIDNSKHCLQLDVTSWPGTPGVLFESDTEEDLKGALFMAGCHIDRESGAMVTTEAAKAEASEGGAAPAQSRSAQPLHGKRGRDEGS